MTGFFGMLREGGWGAYVALLLGVLGVMVGLAGIVTMLLSRRAAMWVGIASLLVSMLGSGAGLLGMWSGQRRTEQAVSGGFISSEATKERIRKMGFLESQSAAKVGFGAALLPLLFGLIAALGGAGAKRKDGSGSSGARWLMAGAAAGAALLPAGGALAASRAALPKGKYPFHPADSTSWDLVEARERVDTDPEHGCDDLDKALDSMWASGDRRQWPRRFLVDPDPVVADWRATATKCARDIFAKIKSNDAPTHWTARALLDSPLLVDEDLRVDLTEYTLSHGAGTGTGGWFPGGHGRLGAAKRPPPRLEEGQLTVAGPLSVGAVRGVLHSHLDDLRACYDNGLHRNPTLTGTVHLAFTIMRDGSVDSSAPESDLADSGVNVCVEARVRQLTFPTSNGATAVTFLISFYPE